MGFTYRRSQMAIWNRFRSGWVQESRHLTASAVKAFIHSLLVIILNLGHGLIDFASVFNDSLSEAIRNLVSGIELSHSTRPGSLDSLAWGKEVASSSALTWRARCHGQSPRVVALSAWPASLNVWQRFNRRRSVCRLWNINWQIDLCRHHVGSQSFPRSVLASDLSVCIFLLVI